jgi:hypothetical protein
MHRRRITARRSPVHGRGVFALQPIAAGERLIEYAGEVTSWRRAAARQQSGSGHTFVFGLSDGRVIDGSRGGNSARFINHACAPNCEAIETGDRVFIMLSSPSSRETNSSSITAWQSTARSPTKSAPTTHVIAAQSSAADRCSLARIRRVNSLCMGA